MSTYSGKVEFHELDTFRWKQMRSRHGWLGSLLRITRDNAVNCLYGLAVKFMRRKKVAAVKTDFLLLQSSPKVIGLQRKRLLKDAIRARGYQLEETALDDPIPLLKARAFLRPCSPTPLRYLIYAAHAEWLIQRYAPKVLLNDRNGTLYSPFLHAAIRRQQGYMIQLSHATTLEASRRLDMNDYDYYFLFGRSSLEALEARPLRFGNSTVLLTGSHMIDQSFDLPPADRTKRVVLILGVGPDKEKKAGYLRTYALLRDWASEHPDYLVIIKSHPRSTVPFWREAAETLVNINVLPPETTLPKALEQASLVVNIMSNAVIEAALAGRPIIYCNLSEERDIFSQEQYFGASTNNVDAFQAKIASIEANFDSHCERSRKFSNFHLAHGFQGLNITVQALKDIIETSMPDSNVESQPLNAIL